MINDSKFYIRFYLETAKFRKRPYSENRMGLCWIDNAIAEVVGPKCKRKFWGMKFIKQVPYSRRSATVKMLAKIDKQEGNSQNSKSKKYTKTVQSQEAIRHGRRESLHTKVTRQSDKDGEQGHGLNTQVNRWNKSGHHTGEKNTRNQTNIWQEHWLKI